MTDRFFNHFTAMTLLHGLLLLGSWQLLQDQNQVGSHLRQVNSVVKLHLSSSPAILPQVQPLAPKPNLRPTQPIQNTLPQTPQVSVVPQATTGTSGDSVRKDAVIDLYKAELRARIDQNKYYPTMSRRLGQVGTVVIAFTLLEDGNIVDIRIDKPSQYERLNFSALDAVKKIERFKPIPKEVGEVKMDIKVPVKFVTI